MIWTKPEARQLIDRVLSFSKGGECAVSVSSSESSHTRYANNEITTSGDSRNVSVNITATIDKRSGRVSINELTDEALKRGVRPALARGGAPRAWEGAPLRPPRSGVRRPSALQRTQPRALYPRRHPVCGLAYPREPRRW